MKGREITRHQGVLVITDENGKKTEIPTFTCPHCNKVFDLKGDTNAGVCLSCFQPICVQCATESKDTERCDVFERKLERMESVAHHRSSLFRAAGI